MQARLDWYKVSGGAYRAMAGLEGFVRDASLDPALLHLIKKRVSQINGCAYCLDMHSKDARAAGETEQRLYELDAWRETPFYSEAPRWRSPSCTRPARPTTSTRRRGSASARRSW